MLASVETLSPEDHEEARQLIDRCMRPGATLSMAEDFPLLVGRPSRARRLIVRSAEGRIQSHVAARLNTVALPSGQLIRCANIGAVCSAPEARGQGFAARLMEEMLKGCCEDGVELAMLWSEVDGFYERFGFRHAGLERRFFVNTDDLRGVTPAMARWMVPEDIKALLHLRRQGDPCSFGRPHEEARLLYQLPLSRTLVALDGPRITASVTLGKGLDFEGAVCEWSGSPKLLPGLLKTLLRATRLSSVLVLGPGWDETFSRTFTSLGCPWEDADLGMFKILNPEPLLQELDLRGAQDLPHDPDELLYALIGKQGRRPRDATLPFYVWGLDSM